MAQTNTVSVFVQMTTLRVESQIGRKIVPNCYSSDCEVPSAKCSFCPSDSEAAGRSRSKMSSARHRGDRHTVSSQVWWRQSVQTLVHHHC